MPRIKASTPFEDIRIVDLTRVRSGPTCVKQFADFGADVIKVESVEAEDLGGSRDGPDFQNLHRNKRAMTLNLKDPDGIKIFRKLSDGADVVADGLKPVPHTPYPTAGMDIALVNRDGTKSTIKLPDILPHDRARFAGEQVAMVVAETLAIAKDAAERVMVDYEPLPAITRTPARYYPLHDESTNTAFRRHCACQHARHGAARELP